MRVDREELRLHEAVAEDFGGVGDDDECVGVDGTGVLAGITKVSNVHGYVINEYERVPCEGELFYRGIGIEDIVNAADRNDRFGYDEASWLLLFGSLPTQEELDFYDTITYRKSKRERAKWKQRELWSP